ASSSGAKLSSGPRPCASPVPGSTSTRVSMPVSRRMDVRPVAIVAGGAGGIGSAIVRRLLEMRHDVVVADAQVTSSTLVRRATPRAFSYRIDLTDRGQVERLIEETCNAFGGIRVLVNSAGGAVAAPFIETTKDL